MGLIVSVDNTCNVGNVCKVDSAAIAGTVGYTDSVDNVCNNSSASSVNNVCSDSACTVSLVDNTNGADWTYNVDHIVHALGAILPLRLQDTKNQRIHVFGS